MEQPFLGKETTLAELHAFPDEEFQKLSLRQRYRMYLDHMSAANYTNPVFLLVVLYIIFGGIWFAGYYYLVMDKSQELFSDLNMRKFILYNILHGVLGFGACSGPLGTKNKIPLGATGLTFLTPGSLCSPLFPSLVGLFQTIPGKRGILGVVAFIFYVMTLIGAIMDPTISRVMVATAALGVASVFDFYIFFACRGEHYGYHMVCMMFPDWIAGCQWVQFMMWIMVGFSKIGPWFKYVVQVLVKDAVWTPCMPKRMSARLFMKDWPNDFSPSKVSSFLGCLGALCEWVFPLCCFAAPGTSLNFVGVLGMMLYHTLIWMTVPLASVFEWQYYTIFMTYFLYYRHQFTLPNSPPLLVFLVIVSLVLPIIGQLYPKLVPFLMAYRQYAGNWRIGWFMIRKSARKKVEQIKVWNPIYFWEAAPPEFGGNRMEYMVVANYMMVPQFRGMFSVFEKFFEDSGTAFDDYEFVNSFSAMNAICGWDLAVGWLWYRECFRTALVEVGGFEPGEFFFFQCEPVSGLRPHNLQYRLMDITKGPQDAEVFVDLPYAELEGTHPLELYLKPERMKRGQSIQGTFLSTYY